MDSLNGSHSCTICNKKYSSYKSLWNHNKKYHNPQIHNSPETAQNCIILAQNSTIIAHKCRFCNKIFSRNYSIIRHEKTCKHKEKCVLINSNELVELKNKIKELEDKIVTCSINNTNNRTINNNNNN